MIVLVQERYIKILLLSNMDFPGVSDSKKSASNAISSYTYFAIVPQTLLIKIIKVYLLGQGATSL